MPSTHQDLDLLHDVELLGRCLLESIEPKLGEYGLDWDKALAFTNIFFHEILPEHFENLWYRRNFEIFEQFVPVRW